MASTSEVGHAKNIANLNLLNTNIAAWATSTIQVIQNCN